MKQQVASLQAFDNPEELWQQLDQQPQGRRQAWYDQAVKYWDQQDASIDGVLGGYGHVSDADILESEKFLRKVRQQCNAATHLQQ